MDNFKEKYLMYKAKYVHLKNNPPMRGGGDNDIEVLLFKAEWCGHCKRFKSTWDKLKENFSNKYKFIAYDADNDKDIIEKYNVQGFPTIKFKKGDKVVEYQGSRDIESLSSMIESL